MDNEQNGGALSSNAMMDAVKMLAMLAQAGSQLNTNNVQAGVQLNTNNVVASPASSVDEGQMVRRVLLAKSSEASASKSKRSSSAFKPMDSNDEDDVEEEVVVPKKKPAQQSQALVKRKPGCPRKYIDESQEEDLSVDKHVQYGLILNLPKRFDIYNEMNFGNTAKDCKMCRMYLATVILKPCGHAGFCFQCINKLRDLTFSSKSLQKCPVNFCPKSITGWF